MANQQQYGSFLPTTFVWDVSQIYEADVNSVQFKELLVRLHEFVNLIAVIVNTKDTGIYVLDEFVNGQLFFPNPTAQASQSQQQRQANRKAFIFGPLPNAGTLTIPHGLTCTTQFSVVRFYGAASNTTSFAYIPLPYVTLTAADNVQIRADGTNIYITTGIDYSAYNVCYIVLEYLKQ